MKLIFLGTRGGIKVRSPDHQFHSSLLIIYRNTRMLIDCGSDWLDNLNSVSPDVIFITHAHPDHAAGLKNGAPCPVYATSKTWHVLRSYTIQFKKIIMPYNPIEIGGLQIEAFPVEHSLNAPAVGYRVTAQRSFFYVPDLVYIYKQRAALNNIALYIGDGARLEYPLIRKKDGYLIGHTSIAEQLKWCYQEKVPAAIFTHCGSPIVKSSLATIQEQVAQLGAEHNIKATVAYDGMEIIV